MKRGSEAAMLCLVLAAAAWGGAGAARGPHHPRHARKFTQDTQLLRDVQHIQDDLGGWVSKEDTSKMSPEELEFHYFKLHDFDNNTKLDGLEILQAIHHTTHRHGEEEEEGQEEEEAPSSQQMTHDFDYFVELIDKVLEEDDLDHDGYLSYVEYVMGRQKDEHKRRQLHPRP